MKLKLLSLSIMLTGIIFAACSPLTSEQVVSDQPVPSGGGQSAQSESGLAPVWDQTTQVDGQGAVVVEVTPLNLNMQDRVLEFEIVMDTHSVDLSIDLALLATLTTNAGVTVTAATWDAPRGGHHVTGKLIFPSLLDEKSILDGAANITIRIRDVDVSLREFVWKIQ